MDSDEIVNLRKLLTHLNYERYCLGNQIKVLTVLYTEQVVKIKMHEERLMALKDKASHSGEADDAGI
jgi:hypothetical protein